MEYATKNDGGVAQPALLVAATELDDDYETVAASQTNQAMGAAGAVGDFLRGILVVPSTTSPGAVTIKDGTDAAVTVFVGGATSVQNLLPFFIPLGLRSRVGAWQVTTGAALTAIGVGNFT